ncbi:Sugar transport protein 14 [Capsicum baccatum]|uniref:Sugar transport protein 14 n=1 Tax=Capsicum baccatum TaxID=33114 RepID=A0A2G2X3K3_CAPBA|nr:Sugar transport protein 14 [Capsicum baccatum]
MYMTGKLEKARQVLEKVRGTLKVDAEYDDLIDASNTARAIKHTFRNLLSRKNGPQLVIGAIAIPAFQQLTGINSILFYSPVVFQSLGFGSSAALYSSAITGGVLVVAAFGRRSFFLEAGAEMIIIMVISRFKFYALTA